MHTTALDDSLGTATIFFGGYKIVSSPATKATATSAVKDTIKAWGSTDNLINSANSTVKGNTAVGRAFRKHAVREGTAFTGQTTGNPAKNTEQGMRYLNKILNDPATFTVRNTKAYGYVLDVSG